MEGENREREREMDRGDGQQMGTPLLLSADHSFFIKEGFLGTKEGQRWTK